jgi:dihydroneopterin aldolase
MNQHLLPWTVQVANLETRLRVGIWEHEKSHQPVNISMIIEGLATGQPASIGECINYEPICRWLIDDWPELPHTELIETRILELAQFIFDCDSRIWKVDLALSKPSAYPQVQHVGMRLAFTRDQFSVLEQAREHAEPTALAA